MRGRPKGSDTYRVQYVDGHSSDLFIADGFDDMVDNRWIEFYVEVDGKKIFVDRVYARAVRSISLWEEK